MSDLRTDLAMEYSLRYQPPQGDYRKFDKEKDYFPGLPEGVVPLFILENKQYTFLWAFDNKRNYLYEWDKVSSVYNSVRFEGR